MSRAARAARSAAASGERHRLDRRQIPELRPADGAEPRNFLPLRGRPPGHAHWWPHVHDGRDGAAADNCVHTIGSENDIRCQVIRRKVSAGTRSDTGRDCRDAFLGLAKTCAKHGVAFWDYLGSRLNVIGQLVVPPLPELVRCRGQPA